MEATPTARRSGSDVQQLIYICTHKTTHSNVENNALKKGCFFTISDHVVLKLWVLGMPPPVISLPAI